MRILLLEDERSLSRLIAEALIGQGYLVDPVATLAEAEAAAAAGVYTIAILDRRLPDGDGLALARLLKAAHDGPRVLILTARNETQERIEGLDRGADDYLGKPFAMEELFARVRALARRNVGLNAPAVAAGRLSYRPTSRSFEVSEQAFAPPRREFLLLEALVQRLGRVILKEALIEAAWSFDDAPSDNALEAAISRLRRRLDEADAGVALQAVRGVGYILTAA